MSTFSKAREIKIKSFKHNGTLHRVWEDNVMLKHTDDFIIGANNHTSVREGGGKRWHTKAPAVFYFHADFWFNIIGMMKGNDIKYYCNISSPFLFESGSILYIDYDLDVIVKKDMSFKIVDKNEYEFHKKQMHYSKELEEVLYSNLEVLIQWIQRRKGPFTPGFINEWYERYLIFKGKNK